MTTYRVLGATPSMRAIVDTYEIDTFWRRCHAGFKVEARGNNQLEKGGTFFFSGQLGATPIIFIVRIILPGNASMF
jgi:hypothetical protein